jgi:hypothetical protein
MARAAYQLLVATNSLKNRNPLTRNQFLDFRRGNIRFKAPLCLDGGAIDAISGIIAFILIQGI